MTENTVSLSASDTATLTVSEVPMNDAPDSVAVAVPSWLEGIDFAAFVAAKQTALTAAQERRAKIAVMLESADSDLASAESALASVAANSPVEKAREMGEALLSAGLSGDNVRDALRRHFGLTPVKSAPKPVSASTGERTMKRKDNPLTSAAQAEILAAVRAAGSDGIRLEKLRERFHVAKDDKGGLHATLWNALVDNQVELRGQTRGATYHWIGG